MTYVPECSEDVVSVEVHSLIDVFDSDAIFAWLDENLKVHKSC